MAVAIGLPIGRFPPFGQGHTAELDAKFVAQRCNFGAQLFFEAIMEEYRPPEPLNARQQAARALAYKLKDIEGVWVINPMPLPDCQPFRIQLLVPARNRLRQMIKDWGFDEPTLASVTPRIMPSGLEASETWVISLEKRTPVVDDRASEPQDVYRAAVEREEYLKMLKTIRGEK